MVHVAPARFYNKVKELLAESDSEIHLFEGLKKVDGVVKPKWAGLLSQKGQVRELLSTISGWTLQNQDDINTHHKMNIRADMSEDDFYKKMTNVDIFDGLNDEKTLSDFLIIFKDVVKFINDCPRTKKLCGLIIRSFLRSLTVYEFHIKKKKTKKKFEDIVLNQRNIILADNVINTESKNIIITYGLSHWSGLLTLLNQNNQNWSIVKRESF